MIEWPTVSAIAIVCTAFGAAGRHFYGWAVHESGIALQARSAESLATAALAKLELYTRELAEHRLEDAKMFAKLEGNVGEIARGQIATENRIAKAIEDLGHEMNEVRQRVDRLLDNR